MWDSISLPRGRISKKEDERKPSTYRSSKKLTFLIKRFITLKSEWDHENGKYSFSGTQQEDRLHKARIIELNLRIDDVAKKISQKVGDSWLKYKLVSIVESGKGDIRVEIRKSLQKRDKRELGKAGWNKEKFSKLIAKGRPLGALKKKYALINRDLSKEFSEAEMRRMKKGQNASGKKKRGKDRSSVGYKRRRLGKF